MAKQDLIKKLTDEKFNGVSPSFREDRFDQLNVQCAEDKENWYMLYAPTPVIIVQEKAMKKPPYCYSCGGSIDYITRFNSVHFKEFTDLGVPAGGGEVRRQRIPYCANCNEKPTNHGVITESIQESLGR